MAFYAFSSRKTIARMTTKLISAASTRPMLMRASPMSNPNWSKLFLPTMAERIGLMMPSMIALTTAYSSEGR